MLSNLHKQFLFIFSFISIIKSEFTQDFRNFLDSQYGTTMTKALERLDMGLFHMGSFGGKLDAAENITNRPIIFIHGVTLRASAFLEHRKFFMANGYTSGELYATTYSDGGMSSLFVKKMNCEDVKQVRNLILAVSEYTQSKVDIVAYSMGVAITRKAILGGQCVDTLENLGKPLTDLIDTYIGLGGVAYGLESCSMHEQTWPSCNLINGMSCNSKYLKDVNSQNKRYEGKHSYSVYSYDDGIVGQNCCGHKCSEIRHANLTVTKRGYDHVSIMALTKELQFSLMKYKTSHGL